MSLYGNENLKDLCSKLVAGWSNGSISKVLSKGQDLGSITQHSGGKAGCGGTDLKYQHRGDRDRRIPWGVLTNQPNLHDGSLAWPRVLVTTELWGWRVKNHWGLMGTRLVKSGFQVQREALP